MKAMKYIFALLSLLFLSLASCSEEVITKDGSQDVDGLNLSLSISKGNIISPLTKSAQSEADAITDLNILIYNTNDASKPAKAFYYTSGENIPKANTNYNKETAKNYNIPLSNGTYAIRAVANVGRDLESESLYTVDGLTFDLKDDGSPYLVMYAKPESGDITVKDGKCSVSLALTRIYSMVTVRVEDRTDADISIVPTCVTLEHVPMSGGFSANQKIGENGVSLASDDNVKELSGRCIKVNDLTTDHSEAAAFFLYENVQPRGTYSTTYNGRTLSTNTKPALGFDKTPASIKDGPTSMSSIVETDETCSFIRIVADYKVSGVSKGSITYRFFLGDNVTDNFEVIRNNHYQVTLILGGKGGTDEVSWRVITDIENDFSTSDVYIGYLDGSKAQIPVNLGSEDLTSLTIEGDDKQFSVSGAQGSGLNRYFDVTANLINVSGESHYVATYKIKATFETGSPVTKTVRVHQVCRLVDPIAIYKKGTNVDPFDIKVKEYTKGDKDYHILRSNGPWSATIESGDWFSLEKDNKVISGIGNTICCEEGGNIEFTYTPNSQNSNTGDNGARYGVILVKYHNLNCEHRIYLRQGYNPTTMGNAIWSLYNCLGKQSDGRVAITTSPTQTGWFFVGGWNVGIHPFKPGYNTTASKFQLSTGESKSWSDIKNEVNKKWDNPCPSGYKLPTSGDFASIGHSGGTYKLVQGFVYDDDIQQGETYPIGWTRNEDGTITLDDSNRCNPAKGTLIVGNSTDPRNLFFPYGKGVMNSHNQYSTNTDINLDEIGVGLRMQGNGTLLYGVGSTNADGTYKDRYGAFYYTGENTPGYDTGANYFYSADFWYDMTSSVGSQYVGANLKEHYGMYVRCVKSR